jgi:ABC-type polysaccharide/polyol phosphate export permease
MGFVHLYHSLKRFLGLSFSFAKASIKAKNEGSWLGYFWFLLSPLLMFSLLFLAFMPRLGKEVDNYAAFLITGIIIFNLFQRIADESILAIFGNAKIIKSISFMHEALIGGFVFKNLVSHLFEILLLSIIFIATGIPLYRILFYIPILMLFLLFCLGVGLILSTIMAYMVDLDQIWGFLSKLLWFGTPIFYNIKEGSILFMMNLFNPMYYYITVSRDILVYGRLSDIWLIIGSFAFAVISLLIGLLLYDAHKKRFAELI